METFGNWYFLFQPLQGVLPFQRSPKINSVKLTDDGFIKHLNICRLSFHHLSDMNHDEIPPVSFIVIDIVTSIKTNSQGPNGFTALSQDKWKQTPTN